jgi:serine/threonine protein kinase
MIDFDCAMLKKQAKFEMWTKTGSFHYQAPEYFCSTVYDEKVDLWAVGVVAYELVSGLLPFNCIYYNRMIKMITENEADIHSLKVSDDFKLMLSKMLEKHPNKRYTASQCLRLPLLLKEEQISISKALDDFNIKLK